MAVLVEHGHGGKRGFGGTLSGRDKVSISSPAPGYRDAGKEGESGGLMRVGNDGYSWQSTFSDLLGTDLSFNMEWLDSDRADYRGYGLQLRCLSE